MVRAQIQLPEPLYRELKRTAKEQDWSPAEIMRRGVEAVVRNYPAHKRPAPAGFSFPPPVRARLQIIDPARLKDAIHAEEAMVA